MDRLTFLKGAAGLVATLSVGHGTAQAAKSYAAEVSDVAGVRQDVAFGVAEEPVYYLGLYSKAADGPFAKAGWRMSRGNTITFPPVTWPSGTPLHVEKFDVRDAKGELLGEFPIGQDVRLYSGDYLTLDLEGIKYV